MDAADVALRGDLTAEVEEAQLLPGPVGSTDVEVPLFAGAARIVSLRAVASPDGLLNFLCPTSAPPRPAGRLTEAPPSAGPIGTVPAERAPSAASSLSDEHMDPGPTISADRCPHAPRMPRLAPLETERTTGAGPTG